MTFTMWNTVGNNTNHCYMIYFDIPYLTLRVEALESENIECSIRKPKDSMPTF